MHLVGFIIKKFDTMHGHMDVRGKIRSSLLHAQAFCFFFILNNLQMCKIWLTTYKLYTVYSEEDSSRLLRNVLTLTTLHGVLTQNITIFIFTTVQYRPTQDAKATNNKILYFNVIFSDMFRFLRHYEGEIHENTNGRHINITIHIHKFIFFISSCCTQLLSTVRHVSPTHCRAIIRGYNIINEWSFCTQRLRTE